MSAAPPEGCTAAPRRPEDAEAVLEALGRSADSARAVLRPGRRPAAGRARRPLVLRDVRGAAQPSG